MGYTKPSLRDQIVASVKAAKTRKEKKPKPPDLTNPKSKANIQKPVYRGNSNNRRNLKDYWTT